MIVLQLFDGAYTLSLVARDFITLLGEGLTACSDGLTCFSDVRDPQPVIRPIMIIRNRILRHIIYSQPLRDLPS